MASLDLSFSRSLTLLWLIDLLSTSSILLLLIFFLLFLTFLPLWVYALKQNKSFYVVFVHTWEEAEVNMYFQSLIFNQEIILSFQIFIINVTEIFMVLNAETYSKTDG